MSPPWTWVRLTNFADVAVSVTYNGARPAMSPTSSPLPWCATTRFTKDAPFFFFTTYDDMIASGKTTGVEYLHHPDMTRATPYHFSTVLPVFCSSTPTLGRRALRAGHGRPGGTDFANWLKAQRRASSPVHGRHRRQAFLDGKAAYTVTGPEVAAFHEFIWTSPSCQISSAGSRCPALLLRPDLPECQVRQPGRRHSSSTTSEAQKRCRTLVVAPPRA